MKRYYMYIPLDIDKQKNTRFVLETDGIPTTSLFKGKVVARNKKSYWYLGQESSNFVNPIADLEVGGKPSFFPICKDEAMKNFDEHCIEDQ
jgi:hypothetical protein